MEKNGTELIGKYVKHVTEPSNTQKTMVVEVKNGSVYLENNGRISLDKFYDNFLIVENSTPSIQNQSVQVDIQPQQIYKPNENFASVESATKDILDSSKTGSALLGALSDWKANPHTSSNIDRSIHSDESLHIKHDNPQIQDLEPSTRRRLQEYEHRQKEIKKKEDEWIKNQGLSYDNPINSQDDDGGDVRRVDFSDVENNQKVNEYANNVHKKKASFPKLKKDTKVTLNLKLDTMTPKVDAIKGFNDLFEESIIDFLAEEITSDFLSNPSKLEDMIKTELHNIVYKKPVKRTSRKPSSTKSKLSTTKTASTKSKTSKN